MITTYSPISILEAVIKQRLKETENWEATFLAEDVEQISTPETSTGYRPAIRDHAGKGIVWRSSFYPYVFAGAAEEFAALVLYEYRAGTLDLIRYTPNEEAT